MLGKAKVLARLLYREGPAGVWNKIAHWRGHKAAQPRIDAEYGTDTLAWVQVEDMSASGENVAYATEYGPSPVFDSERILKQLPIDFPEHVFLDLGCGKGLMLIVATRFGFRRIVGVEFGRNLYETTLNNLDKFRRGNGNASGIEVVLGDAAEFELPAEPLVIYLYHPFGPEVISKVLTNLRRSLIEAPRSCWIVYVNPIHHEVFEECDFLRTYNAVLSRDFGEPYALYRYSGDGPESRSQSDLKGS